MNIKSREIFIFVVLLTVMVLFGGREAASVPNNKPMDLSAMSEQCADLAKKVSSGTVFLSVVRNNHGEIGRGLGTGFVVDAVKGVVVTNAHVVEGSTTAMVHFSDGREVKGTLLGVDVQTDLAVLDIPPGAAHDQLAWGDSDALRPGNMVMAVGSPLGLEGTTSLGVISALGRQLKMVEDSYEDFLQFDAFIDRGSSGGPLVNMEGEVIGINTAIGGAGDGAEPMWRGIGYAIPTAIAKRYVQDLATTGVVRRGWIGVSVRGLNAQGAKLRGLNHTYGVNVDAVVKGGPAAQAGIRKDDVLLAIDGREVHTANQVKARVAAVAPESTVKIKILSQRAIRTIRVTVGERAPVER